MSRNLEQEIDEIKQQIKEMKSLLIQKQTLSQENKRSDSSRRIQKLPNINSDPVLMSLLDRIENICELEGDTGRVTYLGVFSSGGRQSTWIQHEVSTDELLRFIENRTAEKVLDCIGNNDRLNILLALLKEPMTVAALVEKYSYNSTGQVYHHLKPLIAANLITEDKNAAKGTYIVQPHKVQGIIMLLAGIHDIVDV